LPRTKACVAQKNRAKANGRGEKFRRTQGGVTLGSRQLDTGSRGGGMENECGGPIEQREAGRKSPQRTEGAVFAQKNLEKCD